MIDGWTEAKHSEPRLVNCWISGEFGEAKLLRDIADFLEQNDEFTFAMLISDGEKLELVLTEDTSPENG